MTASKIIQPGRAGLTRRGFSLIELVVVLIITAILAAVAIPAVASVGSTRQKLAARQVVRDLTFARRRAMATGRVHWVTFRTSDDTYSILEEPAAAGRVSALPLTDPATGRTFLQRFNAADFAGVRLLTVNLAAGAEVGFDWLGRPRVSDIAPLSSTGAITLSGAVVQITPETGLASWQ